jgi:hypothetical protein
MRTCDSIVFFNCPEKALSILNRSSVFLNCLGVRKICWSMEEKDGFSSITYHEMSLNSAIKSLVKPLQKFLQENQFKKKKERPHTASLHINLQQSRQP